MCRKARRPMVSRHTTGELDDFATSQGPKANGVATHQFRGFDRKLKSQGPKANGVATPCSILTAPVQGARREKCSSARCDLEPIGKYVDSTE